VAKHKLLKIFNLVKAKTGKIPPVIDARDLQNRPRETLLKLCESTGVPFSESMLLWKKGISKKDGPWTKRGWYENVSNSTSFKPYQEIDISILPEYEKLCIEIEQVYLELKRYAL